MIFIGHSVTQHPRYRKRFEGMPTTVPSFRNAARHGIKEFERTGRSGPHSTNGDLLAPVLNYCCESGIPFELRMGVGGAFVWRLNANGEREAAFPFHGRR